MSWTVTKERQNKRISICESCKHFRDKTRTCGKPVIGEKIEHNGEIKRLCGCFMDTKTKLKYGSCPLELWSSTKEEMKELLDNKEFLSAILDSSRVSAKDLSKAYQLYTKITGARKSPGSCPPCIKADLKQVIKKIESALED